MIVETGKVVAVETDGVWVETASQSACGACSARKGCGQSLLAQVQGHRSYIKATLNGHLTQDFQVGDVIEIGVHESAVTRGSLLVYCLPLLGLVIGAGVGDAAGIPEAGVAAFAAAGLALSGLGVRWFSRHHNTDERFQPVVVRPAIRVASTEGVPLQSLEVTRL